MCTTWNEKYFCKQNNRKVLKLCLVKCLQKTANVVGIIAAYSLIAYYG